MNTTKILNDICLISRQGVCLLDMKQVMEKAQELGLSALASTIERDLSENKVLDGQYYTAVSSLLGVQS